MDLNKKNNTVWSESLHMVGEPSVLSSLHFHTPSSWSTRATNQSLSTSCVAG